MRVKLTHHSTTIFVEEGKGKWASIFGSELSLSKSVDSKISIGENSSMTTNSPGEFPRVDFIAVNVDKVSCVAGQGAEKGVAAEGLILVDTCETDATSF